MDLKCSLLLLFLWAIHGYLYSSATYRIKSETLKHEIFDCLTQVLLGLFALTACRMTRTRRAVIVFLLVLSALVCLGLAMLESLEGRKDKVSTLSHVVGFLIGCSWNIVWLLSVELMGKRARCCKT